MIFSLLRGRVLRVCKLCHDRRRNSIVIIYISWFTYRCMTVFYYVYTLFVFGHSPAFVAFTKEVVMSPPALRKKRWRPPTGS